jgi:DNA-binding NarL/FixJ family response regulator
VIPRAVGVALFDLVRAGHHRVTHPRVQLTVREQEVLRLLAHGTDNSAIAQALLISPHTVKRHVSNIFGKLDVRTRVQAGVEAERMGLL